MGRVGAMSVGAGAGVVTSLPACDERSRRPPISTSTSDEAGDGGRAVIGVLGDEEVDENSSSLSVDWAARCGWSSDFPEARRENRLDACCLVRRVPRISSQFVLSETVHNGDKNVSVTTPEQHHSPDSQERLGEILLDSPRLMMDIMIIRIISK